MAAIEMRLALIEIGCRGACRISEVFELMRDATKNCKARTSLGHCPPMLMTTSAVGHAPRKTAPLQTCCHCSKRSSPDDR
jgi:hypothetical protein